MMAAAMALADKLEGNLPGDRTALPPTLQYVVPGEDLPIDPLGYRPRKKSPAMKFFEGAYRAALRSEAIERGELPDEPWWRAAS